MNQPDRGPSPIETQLAAPPEVQNAAKAEPPGQTTALPLPPSLTHSRGAVLAILFLVTGAIGIPLLWMNPNFSTTERIVWSIVATIYTAILIGIVVAVLMWSWRVITG